MAQKEEFRVGDKVTILLLNGVQRHVGIIKLKGDGVYEVIGGGIISNSQIIIKQ